MHCSRKTLIYFSAFFWLLIGLWLLVMGLFFINSAPKVPLQPHVLSLITLISPLCRTPSQAAVCLMAIALFVGNIKGKTVLARSAKRQLKRLYALPEKTALCFLFSKGYYFLVASMVLLGICMKYLPISLDTRGFIDVAVGAALIRGSFIYFRSFQKNQEHTA